MALSDQIYLSRDSIRVQIANLAKQYLELESVDLTKSSFLSFMIDAFSTLTTNLLFYQVSTYREFFLTTAQLPESVLNLSAFLGYNTQEAQYSVVSVLLTIPLEFSSSSVTFTIPSGHKFKTADQIEFLTYYTTTVEITNNSIVSVIVQEGNRRFNLSVNIANGEAQFVLPVRQLKLVEQEFQVDQDVQEFQFVTIDVPIDGQVSTMTVEVREPDGSAWTTWTEFNSLYLMTSTDTGYVSRRTDFGRRLFFGNDLIGVQPTPGATVRVIAGVTEGADGNVIASTITSGDRIYTTTGSGVTQVVNYTATNAAPATGGEDEESIDEIRSNSIASITALNRLVTEGDYENLDVVLTDSPFASNSLPVLKRSDIKINEIQIFTSLLYGAETEPVENLVPTRNVTYTIPNSTTFIPRGTEITYGSDTYYTVFDMSINLLNSAAFYEYVVLDLAVSPTLQTSYTSTFDIIATQLRITKSGSGVTFSLQYQSTESNADQATCQLRNEGTGSVKAMTNDSSASVFTYTFDPYTNFPKNEQDLVFRITDPSSVIVSDYAVSVTVRRDLDEFMLSNTATASDGSSIIIYDIPVIEKNYYDGVDKAVFEANVLQAIVQTTDFASAKMITDFANFKFTNTYGDLSNMQYNETTKSDVIDFVATEPTTPALGARYILTSGINKNAIITCTDATNVTYVYAQPNADDIIYVTNEAQKYIFADVGGWVTFTSYNIPLEVEIEVFRENSYSGTLTALADSVREAVFEAFKDRFGANATIYRSEIVDVVQSVTGVDHCRLAKPETSIFFNFDLEDLTEDELLTYGPEYVYFLEDDITVKIL
jgi:hypothetical protein